MDKEDIKCNNKKQLLLLLCKILIQHPLEKMHPDFPVYRAALEGLFFPALDENI